MYTKALETGTSRHRGLIGGTWRRGSFTGDLTEMQDLIFIRRPCSLGLQEIGKIRLWKWESLSIEALPGEPGGGNPGSLEGEYFARDFERETGKRRLWKQSVSFYGRFKRGIWRKGSFTGDSERYVKEGSGNRHLSKGAPLGKPKRKAPLLGTLRDR
jgi:hypothetical protein